MRLELLYHQRRLLSPFAQFPASLLCILNRVWVRGYYLVVFQIGWCGVQCTLLDIVLEKVLSVRYDFSNIYAGCGNALFSL